MLIAIGVYDENKRIDFIQKRIVLRSGNLHHHVGRLTHYPLSTVDDELDRTL